VLADRRTDAGPAGDPDAVDENVFHGLSRSNERVRPEINDDGRRLVLDLVERHVANAVDQGDCEHGYFFAAFAALTTAIT
jgi:hypothetical protein